MAVLLVHMHMHAWSMVNARYLCVCASLWLAARYLCLGVALIHFRRNTAHSADGCFRKWDSACIVRPSGSTHLRLLASSFGKPSFTALYVSCPPSQW
mmetsp:Transcript_65122/g.145426  ORF Transcript_65122/g.145426 Transcript_65122/m.145426 type:complete len:97 (-) Transcript_65122:101-391(-)